MDDSGNRKSRTRIVEMLTDEELEDPQYAGDFASEGLIDQFRRASILLPTEVYVDRLPTHNGGMYGLTLHVAIVPPPTASVSQARLELRFPHTVKELAAWAPNDQFAAYRELRSEAGFGVEFDFGLVTSLLPPLPYLDELLPQLTASYRRERHSVRAPKENIVRAVSDGQRRLTYDFYRDPESGVDPRQLRSDVIVATGNEKLDNLTDSLELAVECRCGLFRLRRPVRQHVDLVLRDQA